MRSDVFRHFDIQKYAWILPGCDERIRKIQNAIFSRLEATDPNSKSTILPVK